LFSKVAARGWGWTANLRKKPIYNLYLLNYRINNIYAGGGEKKLSVECFLPPRKAAKKNAQKFRSGWGRPMFFPAPHSFATIYSQTHLTNLT
jgi:hypothetical protein